MKRILPSHPDYEEINRHNLMLCLLKNPSAHFNIHQAYQEEDELMWNATISDVEDGLTELLEENPFREFLS